MGRIGDRPRRIAGLKALWAVRYERHGAIGLVRALCRKPARGSRRHCRVQYHKACGRRVLPKRGGRRPEGFEIRGARAVAGNAHRDVHDLGARQYVVARAGGDASRPPNARARVEPGYGLVRTVISSHLKAGVEQSAGHGGADVAKTDHGAAGTARVDCRLQVCLGDAATCLVRPHAHQPPASAASRQTSSPGAIVSEGDGLCTTSSFTTRTTPSATSPDGFTTRSASSGARSFSCATTSAHEPASSSSAGRERALGPSSPGSSTARGDATRSLTLPAMPALAAAPRQTETKITRPETRRFVEPVAGPAHLRQRVDAAAPAYPVDAWLRLDSRVRGRASWIHGRRARVEVLCVGVRAPFPHVPVAVEHAQAVGLARAHLVQLAGGILAVPGVPYEVGVVPAAPLGVRAAAAGELPFGLGGKAASHPGCEQRGLVPGDVDHRLALVLAADGGSRSVEAREQLVSDRHRGDAVWRELNHMPGRFAAEVALVGGLGPHAEAGAHDPLHLWLD